MRTITGFRTGSAVAILALALSASACSSGSNEDPTPGPEAAPSEAVDVLDDALTGPDADGDEGRVFDANEDVVIEAVEQTFSDQNARATFSNGTLRVTMDGSLDDPTASIPCTALEALLADGEDAVIVYSDGELVCADR